MDEQVLNELRLTVGRHDERFESIDAKLESLIVSLANFKKLFFEQSGSDKPSWGGVVGFLTFIAFIVTIAGALITHINNKNLQIVSSQIEARTSALTYRIDCIAELSDFRDKAHREFQMEALNHVSNLNKMRAEKNAIIAKQQDAISFWKLKYELSNEIKRKK